MQVPDRLTVLSTPLVEKQWVGNFMSMSFLFEEQTCISEGALIHYQLKKLLQYIYIYTNREIVILTYMCLLHELIHTLIGTG